MNKLRRLRSLSPEMAETLRLAGVQGIFWAAMAVGNYQTVYLQSIGFPATDFGLLNAIACAVAIFAMTFWGTVSDRIGSVRKIVILTLTLGCGLFIFVPLIPTGQSYSTLLFLILIPIINFFRVPMSPFVVVKKSRHEKYLFLICFFKSRHEEYFCRSCFFKSGHGQ